MASSIRSRQVSHGELDLAVGKLPPVFDNRRVSCLRKLIEDLAGFQTSCVNWQREYLWRLNARHPVCQFSGANEHGRTSKPTGAFTLPTIMNARARNQRVGHGADNIVPANHRRFRYGNGTGTRRFGKSNMTTCSRKEVVMKSGRLTSAAATGLRSPAPHHGLFWPGWRAPSLVGLRAPVELDRHPLCEWIS